MYLLQLFLVILYNIYCIQKNIYYIGRRSGMCKECGITTLEAHLPRHYAVHRGEVAVDERSAGGGYFCDLCGLMFRQQFNLFKHWKINSNDINVCDFLVHMVEKVFNIFLNF